MRRLKAAMRWTMGLAFVVAGTNHFYGTAFYLRLMPPYLPWHAGLVYLSGLFEIALGALLLVPRFASRAAWGLIALLVAVFPANLHMALHPDLFPEIDPALLWGRLPLQAAFIAWAYWFTDGRNRVGPSARGNAAGPFAGRPVTPAARP